MSHKNSYPSNRNAVPTPNARLLSRRNVLVGGLVLLGAGAVVRGLQWMGEQNGTAPQPSNPNNASQLSEKLRADLGVKAAALDKQITAAYYDPAVKGTRLSDVRVTLSPSLTLDGIGIEIPAGSTDKAEPYGAYRLETYFHNTPEGQVGDRVSIDEALSKDGQAFLPARTTAITREADESVSLYVSERNTLANPTSTIVTKLNTGDPTTLHITTTPLNEAGPGISSSVPVPSDFVETSFQQAMHAITLATQKTPAPVGGDFTPSPYVPAGPQA
ncbi:MAG TPA: hypothetical protein VFT53_00330 [Candidatus Saccharimonadales bacterium]|nr:hypothetical protein [Candidatus Saccharimonadales bacterium]